MPAGRPQINLDEYQLPIIELFNEGLTYDQIATYLKEEHRINITSRTIKRRFKAWKITRRIPPDIADQVKSRIQVLFFEVGLEDKDILHVLHEEGFQIGKYTLVRLRFELGLRRRVHGVEQCLEADQRVRTLVTQELTKGVIDGYGRNYLHTYFRQRGHIIARDRLFQAYRTINPDAVARRHRDLQRQRGEYIVPGPNYVWSIDAHDKLKPYGVEIYACIDAYSRYITWIYVGISSGTAVSCVRQYLDCIEAIHQQPRFIRSDRGVETVMLADAHHQLQAAKQPELQFTDCYMYGTSTANQRIEAWWQQLSKGYLFRWRNFFRSLQTQGYFSKDSLADRISLYALYLPILREELYSFVRMWNSHTIRRQSNRPNSISGKPYMLYHHPGSHIQNWGLSFDSEQLRTIKEGVQDWDIDMYLPADTLSWCQDLLHSLGFNLHSAVQLADQDRTAPFLDIYLQLRTKTQEHIQNSFNPQLGLLPTLVGARNWQLNQEELVRSVDLDTDPAESIDPNLE